MFGGEAVIGPLVGADDAEEDDEEGDKEGGYEEGYGLLQISVWMSSVTQAMLTSVAHSSDTKTTNARQFCCSGSSMMGTMSSTAKIAMVDTRTQNVLLSKKRGHRVLPNGVTTSLVEASSSSP